MAIRTLDSVKQFPLLIPETPTLTAYHGYLEVGGRSFRVRVSLPFHNPGQHTLAASELHCEPYLSSLLYPYREVVQQQLKESPSLSAFLQELEHLLNSILQANPERPVPPARFYSRIVEELEGIGWAQIASVSCDLTSLEVTVADPSSRQHTLGIHLHESYPAQPPVLMASLPEELPPLSWNPESSSLTDAVAHLLQHVTPFDAFWTEMDIIDKTCWVLEPETPTRGDMLRRLSLGKHCSLEIVVNPHKPRAVPRYRLLGLSSRVQPMLNSLTAALPTWDEAESLKTNLEKAMDIKFPDPVTTSRDELELECRICYSLRFEGETPDVVCENERCGKPFHAKCLVSWLSTLRDTRTSYDTLFGQCPYCKENIMVSSKKRG